MRTENGWIPTGLAPNQNNSRLPHRPVAHSRRRLRIPVNWPHRLSPKRAPRAASCGAAQKDHELTPLHVGHGPSSRPGVTALPHGPEAASACATSFQVATDRGEIASAVLASRLDVLGLVY